MYQMQSRVRYSETDEKGILTFTSAMRYICDCAIFQLDDIGFDIERLLSLDQGWYVASWQVRINRLPHEGEYITVKTIPHRVAGMMGYRDFLLETDDGEICMSANSTWIYMDLKRGKPLKVSDEMKTGFGLEEPLKEEWMDRKIPLCDELMRALQTGEADASFRVLNSHLDTNHHMNNSVYIEAAMNLVPVECSIDYMRAEYKSIAVLGDVVYTKAALTECGMQIILFSDIQDADGKRNLFASVEVYYD